MKSISVTRMTDSSVEKVFRTVAEIGEFSQAVPHITKVEFLTDQHAGMGTRFRETRVMNGREHATELEVTEYVLNERIRMVADAGGTVWDTLFTVQAVNGHVELVMTMEARAYKLLAKILNPLIRGMVAKQVEKDMDSVVDYCTGKS